MTPVKHDCTKSDKCRIMEEELEFTRLAPVGAVDVETVVETQTMIVVVVVVVVVIVADVIQRAAEVNFQTGSRMASGSWRLLFRQRLDEPTNDGWRLWWFVRLVALSVLNGNYLTLFVVENAALPFRSRSLDVTNDGPRVTPGQGVFRMTLHGCIRLVFACAMGSHIQNGAWVGSDALSNRGGKIWTIGLLKENKNR